MKKIIIKLHPVLFCLYPILALWNKNIKFVKLSSAFRGIMVSFILIFIFWWLLKIFIKDRQKTSLITTLSILLFFSYGHIYLFLFELWPEATRHRNILAVLFALLLFFGWLIIWKLKNLDDFEQFLSVTAVVLLLFVFVQAGQQKILIYQASQELQNINPQGSEIVSLENEDVLRDVYWIVLDAHGRSDVLLDYYEYDNSNFIQSLTDMGFYIANCSQTNYPDTVLSLISTMNMNYLQNIVSDSGQLPQLSISAVRKNFDQLGYQTVAFENFFGDHYDLLEDILFEGDHAIPLLNSLKSPFGLVEFEVMLMHTTLLKLFIDMPQLVPDFLKWEGGDSWLYKVYSQTHFSLDTLQNMPEFDAPTFVFAHLIVPHGPYIYAPDGSFLHTENVDEASVITGYRNNISFVDNRMLEIIESIIEYSDVLPIIIVQGDHGPPARKVKPEIRMPILNAYFFPGDNSEELYSHISPVNSFRLVFNEYFNGEYSLLDDLSYMAWGVGGLVEENIVPNNCIGE